jgi:integrase
MLDLNLPPVLGGFNPDKPRMRRPAGPGRHRIRVLCAMGSNMRIRFTKPNIEALEPPPKGELFAWCEDLPGWGVRVLASGRMSWLVQFRDQAGKSRRHTIADIRVLPISLAEKRAREILGHAKLGVDLIAAERDRKRKKAAADERSVGAMVAKYLAEPSTRRKRSLADIKRYLEVAWKPIHGESAETIGREQLAPELRRIAAERGEVAANRAKSAMSTLFVWAITHGELRRENNPTMFLPKWDEASRERVLSLDELGAVWRAAPGVNPTYGAVLRLLMLTGCRRSEISGLTWGEVDLDKAAINLPGSRTKNKRPHVVPLAPAAADLLREVPRVNDVVAFPNFGGWTHSKRALDKRLELAQPWVVHDIRRSVATGLREHVDADTHLVELVINHVSGSRGGVAGVYDRSERLADRRRVLERWAELVLSAAGEAVEEAQVVEGRIPWRGNQP